MFSKLLILAFLAFPILAMDFAQSESLDCSSVKIHSSELGEMIHPEILGNLYARAMLKIAANVVEENLNYSQISNADFVKAANLSLGRKYEKDDYKLTQEEQRALWLVYLANDLDPKINFSQAIKNLIAKKENSIIVGLPQIQLAINSYPIACLEQKFSKSQFTDVMDKLNRTMAANQNDVKIEDNNIKLGETVLVELPNLKITKKKFDSDKTSEFDIGRRLLSEVGGSFNSYRKSNAVIHGVSNLETIKHFHKFYGLSAFAVLSKKDKTLTLYDDEANVLEKIHVNISSEDDHLNAGGAGIYYSTVEDNNVYYAKALVDNGMREVFKAKSNQKINLTGPLYILPSDSLEHKFRIKNKGLSFSGYQFYRKSRGYNYTIPSDLKFQLVIKHNYKAKFVSRYISTLSKEKSRLMQILKIDNDDYDILAGFAIGVLSPETDFGKNWKYILKEFIPGAVSIAKGNGLDISKNSRGPTQVKYISEDIMKYYSINNNNLSNPENAAVATIAISADFLKQLRVVGVNHKLVNEENIQNYLYYLYQGKRAQIKNGEATPEENVSIKKIMNVVNGLEFLEY